MMSSTERVVRGLARPIIFSPDYFEPLVLPARHMPMRHAATPIHLAALAILFATLGQPSDQPKPAGIRRAVETMAKEDKDKALSRLSIMAPIVFDPARFSGKAS